MTARAGRYAALLFFTAAFVLAAGDKAGTCSCFRTPVCGMGIDDRADAALVFLGVVSQTTRSSTRFRVERVLSDHGIAPAVTYDSGATGSNCDHAARGPELELTDGLARE